MIEVPGVSWNAFVVTSYATIGVVEASGSGPDGRSWRDLIIPPGSEAFLRTAEAFLSARRQGSGAEDFLVEGPTTAT